MANESILTPCTNGSSVINEVEIDTSDFLKKSKYLNEFLSEDDKSIVRENLDIYPKSEVYTKTETNKLISNAVTTAVSNYLEADDPHDILPRVEEKIKDFVRTDGSTPFTSPLLGVKPVNDNHLTTKSYVKELLKQHTDLIGSEDPHEILPEVKALLLKYVLISDVYKKSELYTKKETDDTLKNYIKKDGTTAFTKALIGIDPTVDSHLATKRYVDSKLYDHLVDIDPHKFLATLNTKLKDYAKKKNVYDKTETYSRSLLEKLLDSKVEGIVDSLLEDYVESINNKLERIRLANYVKLDGTIPFTNPLSGVDAIYDEHLTTLGQVKSLLDDLSDEINSREIVWIPSGPVESTVGHVEDNTEFNLPQTILEIFDAIFYGKSISINVPEFIAISKKCPITVCIHGATGNIKMAEIYQEGLDDPIYTWNSVEVLELFKNGCVTVDSLPIYDRTKFIFKVYYNEGTYHELEATVGCSLQVFVGLLEHFRFGNVLSYNELLLMERLDNDNNSFLNDVGDNVTSIQFKYNFVDAKLRHPFIVVPYSYPNLESINTSTLKFGIEAFSVIDMIPLLVPGIEKDVIYKMYIYKLALSSLNEQVTFNFESK